MTRKMLARRIDAMERVVGSTNNVRVIFQPEGLNGDALRAWREEIPKADGNYPTIIVSFGKDEDDDM